MTKTATERFMEGRQIWQEYVKVNGYSWEPTRAGLEKLSRRLDLNIPYLKKVINAFLEA